MTVNCKGCGRRITPAPDTNLIRVVWTCTNLLCSEYGRCQQVMYARDFFAAQEAARQPERAMQASEGPSGLWSALYA